MQYDVTYFTPVTSLKLTFFSNWRTARPIQFDVKYFTHVASLKLTFATGGGAPQEFQY